MNKITYLNQSNWLQERFNGIGASDIPILCQKSSYMTPYELWEYKVNKKEKEIDEETQKLIDAGHEQEPLTLYNFLKNTDDYYCSGFYDYYYNKKRTNYKYPVQLFTKFYHPKYKFMFCHPDMIFQLKNKLINVEGKYIKYPNYEWDFENLTEDGIPQRYYLQIQYQMMITGIKKTILVVNHQGSDFYNFEINANKELFPIFEKICIDFWKLVENKTPPMPTNLKDAKKLFPDKKQTALSLQGDIEMQTLIQKDRYTEIKKKISYLKHMQDKIKSDILSLMGTNNIIQTSNGERIASITENESDKFCSIKDIRNNKKLYNYCKKNKIIIPCINKRINF